MAIGMNSTSSEKDETLSEVLDLKNKAETNLKNSVAERESLRQKIRLVRSHRQDLNKSTSEKVLEKLKIQLELENLNQEIEMLQNHNKARHEQQNEFLSSINDLIQMTDFEQGMKQLRSSIENGIVFYRDENLQMELHKRKNVTRDLRVKYTEVEQRYKDKLRRIEEEKRRAEEARRVKEEAERQRLDEERKRVEIERRRLEEENRGVELVAAQKSPEPWKSPASGRSSVDTSGRGSEFGARPFEDPKLNLPNGKPDSSIVGGGTFGALSSFTQLLKW